MPLQKAEDCLCDAAEGSFMQSRFWGLFKARTGWEAFEVSGSLADDLPALRLLVLRRRMWNIFSFLYVPHGPSADFAGNSLSIDARMRILGQLGAVLAETFGHRDLFIRFDLDWERGTESLPGLIRGLPLKKGADVQVPDTVLLDLAASEESLLDNMKPKWRYNIRLAQKRGVSIIEAGKEGIPDFMALYAKTARRDHIAIHSQSYYETLFETAEDVARIVQHGRTEERVDAAPSVSLYFADHEGDRLAAIIVLRNNHRATYLYGASADIKRNLMPAYALQWHAIRESKRQGCLSYDFFGIPPHGDDPGHPMAGLYLFKTGFGGRIVHRVGALDYPIRPIFYTMYRCAEKIRLFWHRRAKKASRRQAARRVHADS